MKRLFLLLLICSCTVGPDYQRPCLDIPESYVYETEEAEDTLDTLWWTEFKDPILNEMIVEALAYNKDLKAAEGRIIEALGLFISTRAELFPQIGYNGSLSRSRSSEVTAFPLSPTIKNPSTNFQLFSTVNWELDIWGRIKRLTEAAKANLIAQQEAYRSLALSIVAAVANGYFQLRGLDEQLVISEKTLKSYGEAVHYFETQFSYGQVSKMVLVQSQTQYEIAAAKIPQIKIQIVQVENALSILLGKNPESIPRGLTISELQFPKVPCGIPSNILRQRPDILQAEENLIAANALIGAAIALYFPDISLTGAYGGVSEQLKNLFTGPAKAWNYTGNVIGPIFTFGLIEGKVEEAVGTKKALLFSYEALIQQAFAEVENALASHTFLQDEVKAQERLVAASREYEYLAKLQYDGGYSPYFVVLQAQEQLFPAELSLVQTRVLLLTSLVNIYQAMGGGWVNESINLR